MIFRGGNLMKFRWLVVFALGAAVAIPASAQISAYVDLSASKLTGGLATTTTNVLVGPTIGLTAQLGQKAHLKLSGDLRGGFYGGSRRLDELAIGPKVALPIRKYEAYGEFLVGFGRYNNGQNLQASSSTDAQIEINFGLDRAITKRFDWRVFEFGYEQYYGLGGEFNPKTFSTGLVVHLGGR
jgi:hypothetical protein